MNDYDEGMIVGADADMDTEEAAAAAAGAAATRGDPHVYTLHSVEGLTFRSHDISADSLQQLFGYFEPSAGNQLVDLSGFLGPLKKAKDKFLPGRIYIRDCMKLVFGYFHKDELKKDSNRVLLGSPGVGKSVLFFIAALYKAETIDLPVVYIRKTRTEKDILVFVMLRTESGVRVFWSRNVDKQQFPGVGMLKKAVEAGFGFERRQDVVFLDGPRHNEEKDLNAFYEYFCTSGGHPLPKNEQKDLYLWLLDGWAESEAISFCLSIDHTKDDAKEAYSVCGGCVRDLVEYVLGSETKRAKIRAVLESLVDRAGKTNIDVVLTTTSRNKDDDSGNPDRLRTMFNGMSESVHIPDAIQIVDSAHVLTLLRGHLNLESYFKALKLGKTIKSGTVVGVYFEEILHQWFKESLPDGISKVCVSEGTKAEVVNQLIEKKAYWIPSIPNFPNIDAAVVLGRVLYAFQYTKMSNHEFNVDTFWQDFVTVVREQLEFDRVHIYIVLMDDVSSTLTVTFNKPWTASSGTETSSVRLDICCTSSYVNINTTTAETIRTSAAAGFSFADLIRDEAQARADR